MELPMATIVTIVIVLFVLAAVGISFFNQFNTGNKGFDQSQCVQLCETAKAAHAQKAVAKDSGLCEKDGAAENYCSRKCTAACQLSSINPTMVLKCAADGSVDSASGAPNCND